MNDNEISKPPTELVAFSTGAFTAVCPQLDYCPSLRVEGDLDITSNEVIRDEMVRRYNAHEDLVGVLQAAALYMADPGKSGADLHERLSRQIDYVERTYDIQITPPDQ
jgi:hypothetical protein